MLRAPSRDEDWAVLRSQVLDADIADSPKDPRGNYQRASFGMRVDLWVRFTPEGNGIQSSCYWPAGTDAFQYFNNRVLNVSLATRRGLK